PEVGELVTSFEMAGVSLRLCWLDKELEATWTSPVATPAFRRGVVEPAQDWRRSGPTVLEQSASSAVGFPDATGTSREAAAFALAVLRAMERTIDEHSEEL